MPEIQKVNDTTYGVDMPTGDKVEIGDKEAIDFKPHLKLNRFKGECSLSEGLPDNFIGRLARIDGDKISWEGKWDKVGVFAEFYPLITPQFPMGAYELQLSISSKPKTNKLYLPFSMTNLKAYPQPPLTSQEIDDGAKRPEDIINSLAFYHASKGGIVTPQDVAKGITTGKAFHNLRPRLVNARGDQAWGLMKLINGFKVITIPWELLEGGHYPIKHIAGDTFGLTTIGGSYSDYSTFNQITTFPFTMGVADGVATHLTAYFYNSAGYGLAFVIYDNDSPATRVDYSTDQTGLVYSEWIEKAVQVGASLIANATYRLGFCHRDSGLGVIYMYHDDGTPTHHEYQNISYVYPPPASYSPTASSAYRKYSVFCTYTVLAAPTVTTQAADGIGFD